MRTMLHSDRLRRRCGEE